MVSNCTTCLDERNQQPIISWEIPEIPLTKIGTEIFQLHKIFHVIAVDYVSKFFDIQSLINNLLLLSCILRTCLQNLAFHRHINDYGPEFTVKDLVSLFNGISTFVSYLMSKPSL